MKIEQLYIFFAQQSRMQANTFIYLLKSDEEVSVTPSTVHASYCCASLVSPILVSEKLKTRISESDKNDQERKELQKNMSKDEVKLNNVIILNAKFPKNPDDFAREYFIRYIQNLDRKLPKHIITLDEKYLRRCLQLVYACAMRGTSSSSIPTSLSSRTSTLSEGAGLLDFDSRYGCGFGEFVHCPTLEFGIIGNKTMGMTTKSKGRIDLLKRPLIRQLVSNENSNVDGIANLIDVRQSADHTNSTSSYSSINSSTKPEKKMALFERERFKLESKHKRDFSVSSTCSVSDRSSFSLLDKTNRAMLHCTWKAGRPHYVFSSDGRNEVYIADIIKPEAPNNDGFDYLYTFHTREGYVVGKMRVSTSFKLCRNNGEIKETEFVLLGEDERDTGEVQKVQKTNHNFRRSKGLSKKMSEVFKTGHTSRERNLSQYASTNEKSLVGLSSNFLPNLELASIIMKDHTCKTSPQPEVGGWGMKFLKKIDSKETCSSIETPPCDYFDESSTSVNIIIPAGFHGGPQNRIDGPNSLVERWRHGGKCDCGGWDMGCPITVLNTEQSKENVSQTDIRVSGMHDSLPVMKMVSVRDGLYVVYFHSNLSALQSLSIAVSIIHSQTVQQIP